MTTIGSFLRAETGFSGSVKTSNLHIDNVRFIPAEGGTERGPDFRIYAGNLLEEDVSRDSAHLLFRQIG